MQRGEFEHIPQPYGDGTQTPRDIRGGGRPSRLGGGYDPGAPDGGGSKFGFATMSTPGDGGGRGPQRPGEQRPNTASVDRHGRPIPAPELTVWTGQPGETPPGIVPRPEPGGIREMLRRGREAARERRERREGGGREPQEAAGAGTPQPQRTEVPGAAQPDTGAETGGAEGQEHLTEEQRHELALDRALFGYIHYLRSNIDPGTNDPDERIWLGVAHTLTRFSRYQNPEIEVAVNGEFRAPDGTPRQSALPVVEPNAEIIGLVQEVFDTVDKLSHVDLFRDQNLGDVTSGQITNVHAALNTERAILEEKAAQAAQERNKPVDNPQTSNDQV